MSPHPEPTVDGDYRPSRPPRTSNLAGLGWGSPRLLAGPPRREDLAEHLARVGSLPYPLDGPDLLEAIEESGLAGRGGGYFPLARKMSVAVASPGTPLVVVNATEGEPAVAKDGLLMSMRPHLILDGAEVVAAAVGADRVYVAVHDARRATVSLRRAAASRPADGVPFEFVSVPDRYVAGESTALVSLLNGGPALPAGRRHPTAVRGVAGRPTVVSNAETLAHAALVARFGAGWFREIRTPGGTGSTLLTVQGDVTHPGTVLELTGPATIGQVVAAAGGPVDLPRAVLVGGYTGGWIAAHDAWGIPLESKQLRAAGVDVGCGLVGVLGARRCGLVETAHVASWLAGERAGQCGACDVGLPRLSETLTQVARGDRRGRREVARMVSLGQSIEGRGLCGLPDGTISMVESALRTFGAEVALHRKGRCSGDLHEPLFPAPVGGL